MNRKLRLICILCFNLFYLTLFHSGDGFRLTQTESARNEPRFIYRPQELLRQAPFPASLMAGPVALAAFLFALPLLPTLIMAPLALAGIPPTLNVLSAFVQNVGNGKPLSFILSQLQDPLQTESQTTNGANRPNALMQMDTIKTIARMFRAAISKRQHMDKDKNTYNNYENELNELAANIDEVPNKTAADNQVANQTESNSVSANQLQKSAKKLDTVLTSIKNIYSVIRDGLRRYEITDSHCQSRIVCEIHQKVILHNKMLKSFSLNALDVLSLEKHVDSWSTLNEKSKQTIKFYINAAKIGFADKDCDKEFQNCPTLQSRNFNLQNILFYRNLIKKVVH